MPRAGLDPAVVTSCAAQVADEVGLSQVTMASVADRLGVRAPSLYKHVDGQADLVDRVAVLAYVELGDALREALQGRAGRDALSASAWTVRRWIAEHPGRYAATTRTGADVPTGADVGEDARGRAVGRVLDSMAAGLTDYHLDAGDTVHAMRLFRTLFEGFAVIEAAGGFRLGTDVDQSFEWLVDFVDRGLRALPAPPA